MSHKNIFAKIKIKNHPEEVDHEKQAHQIIQLRWLALTAVAVELVMRRGYLRLPVKFVYSSL